MCGRICSVRWGECYSTRRAEERSDKRKVPTSANGGEMNPAVQSNHLGKSSSALDGTAQAPPDDDDAADTDDVELIHLL